MVLASAQQQAYRRVVALLHHVFLKPSHVGIELANMFMAKRIHFQFHQHMALENTVIKHQVHKAPRLPNQHAFLPRFQTKAMTQLQQKLLQIGQHRLLQVRFRHRLTRFEPQKLKNIRAENRQSGLDSGDTDSRICG